MTKKYKHDTNTRNIKSIFILFFVSYFFYFFRLTRFEREDENKVVADKDLDAYGRLVFGQSRFALEI